MGYCRTTLLTRIPSHQNGVGVFLCPGHRHRATAHQNDDHRLAASGNRFEQVLLHDGQTDIRTIAPHKAWNVDLELLAFKVRRQPHKSNDRIRAFSRLASLCQLRLWRRNPLQVNPLILPAMLPLQANIAWLCIVDMHDDRWRLIVAIRRGNQPIVQIEVYRIVPAAIETPIDMHDERIVPRPWRNQLTGPANRIIVHAQRR